MVALVGGTNFDLLLAATLQGICNYLVRELSGGEKSKAVRYLSAHFLNVFLGEWGPERTTCARIDRE